MYVSSFCGKYSVKTGTLAIALLYMVLNIIAIITLVVTLRSALSLSLMIIPLAHLVCAVLLLIGTQERKVEFVFPTVSTFFVDFIIGLPTISVYFIQSTASRGAPVWVFFVIMLVAALCFVLMGYCFMVVRSFYKELLREKYAVAKVDDYLDVFYTTRQNEQHL